MTGLTLYAIEEELQSLLDTVEVCPEELRPELEARIAEYVGGAIAKVDSIGQVLSTLDAKTPVKEALKKGETVPGVHIEEREHLVRR